MAGPGRGELWKCEGLGAATAATTAGPAGPATSPAASAITSPIRRLWCCLNTGTGPWSVVAMTHAAHRLLSPKDQVNVIGKFRYRYLPFSTLEHSMAGTHR